MSEEHDFLSNPCSCLLVSPSVYKVPTFEYSNLIINSIHWCHIIDIETKNVNMFLKISIEA